MQCLKGSPLETVHALHCNILVFTCPHHHDVFGPHYRDADAAFCFQLAPARSESAHVETSDELRCLFRDSWIEESAAPKPTIHLLKLV